MIELINQGVYLLNGTEIRTDAQGMPCADEARENTITYQILRQHDVDGAKGKKMRIRFDAMMSHDITYVSSSVGQSRHWQPSHSWKQKPKCTTVSIGKL